MAEQSVCCSEVDAQIERENINSWDWAHAERYCQAYLEHDPHKFSKTYTDEARAFTTAIVVTYSRPFSGNRDREGQRDPINANYVAALEQAARELHDRIIDLRNSAFAHSDAKHHDVQIHDTASGGLTTLSRDPLVPLEKTEVEGLLANIKVFMLLNEKLRSDAVAARLACKAKGWAQSNPSTRSL